jgi:hypothetical protein
MTEGRGGKDRRGKGGTREKDWIPDQVRNDKEGENGEDKGTGFPLPAPLPRGNDKEGVGMTREKEWIPDQVRNDKEGDWIPAFAGMTKGNGNDKEKQSPAFLRGRIKKERAFYLGNWNSVI